MKLIDVPILNDDGSVKCTMVYGPEEAQKLLQFATNFFAAIGSTAVMMGPEQPEVPEAQFNDQ